jgi:hypothetical protein
MPVDEAVADDVVIVAPPDVLGAPEHELKAATLGMS